MARVPRDLSQTIECPNEFLFLCWCPRWCHPVVEKETHGRGDRGRRKKYLGPLSDAPAGQRCAQTSRGQAGHYSSEASAAVHAKISSTVASDRPRHPSHASTQSRPATRSDRRQTC